jgi:Predicted membrane protein (DUF2142)
MKSAKITLAVGVALIAVVVAFTLTRSPPRVLQGSWHGSGTELGAPTGDAAVCEDNETLPAGTTAVRISMWAFVGARVRVVAYDGTRVLTEGSHGPDWTSTSVTVPVRAVRRTTSRARLCLAIGPNSEPILILGDNAQPAEAAVNLPANAPAPRSASAEEKLSGRMHVEYLGAGTGSWWSRIGSVAQHVGLGRAYSGTWIAALIAALMIAVGALALRLTLREPPVSETTTRGPRDGRPPRVSARPRKQPSFDGGATRRRHWPAGARAALKRVPRAAWICVLIAAVNGAAWSVIVPPFQGHDEVDHFAYVDHIAQSGTLPGGQGAFVYSPAQSLVMGALGYYTTRFTPFEPSITTDAQQHTLIEAANAGASLEQPEEVGVATTEPPLYYTAQLIPYELGSGNILVQLQLMRLLSVLLASATVLLTFLFLCEILPGALWAATVGALCVALAPQLMSASSLLNPDSLDITITAAVFLCLARAFHRGFTRARAVTLGLLVVAGFLTKLNFVGVALGLVVSVLILSVREVRARGWGALKPVAILAGIGLVPAILYAAHNAAAGRPLFGLISGSFTSFVSHASLNEPSYIWQLYLPRLPGMTHYFAGVATYKDIWWDRWVGFYGWMDTTFPGWVDNVALIPATIIAGLCVRELYSQRAALRARLSEFASYAAVGIGVLVMLGVSSYNGDVIGKTSAFAEPRYLVPLIPLLGAVVVLAVRGAGRRWAPIVGAAVVMLFLGHDLVSQLQVIGRYYG